MRPWDCARLCRGPADPFPKSFQFFTNLDTTSRTRSGLLRQGAHFRPNQPPQLEPSAGSGLSQEVPMDAKDHCTGAASNLVAFLSLARSTSRHALCLATVLFVTLSLVAQPASAGQQDSLPPPPDALARAKPAPANPLIIVPAGSGIALVLTHPI